MKNLSVVFLVLAFVAGCSSTPEPKPVVEAPEAPKEVAPVVEAVTTPADCLEPCIYTKDAINDPNSPLAQRIIFFGYNQSVIREVDQYTIEQHAIYLKSHPSATVRLEGHTDERGSREYNVALGEQRGLSVRQMLLLQGVSSDQITVVSFGEELPLELGRNEAAWAQNRRVEIVYN